jgi:hypothetical protein
MFCNDSILSGDVIYGRADFPPGKWDKCVREMSRKNKHFLEKCQLNRIREKLMRAPDNCLEEVGRDRRLLAERPPGGPYIRVSATVPPITK